MRLHRYFARKFAVTFFVVLMIFAAILALVDLMNQVGRYDVAQIGFTSVLGLTLLGTPAAIYEFLPLAMILASLALFLGLARSSELVVTRALGWSALRVIIAPLVVSLIIGAVAVAVFNPVVSGLGRRYEALSRQFCGGDQTLLSIGADGLWLRQGTEDGQPVIHARSANHDGSDLQSVTFLMFDANGAPTERIDAGRATLEDGFWTLQDAKDWMFNNFANPEAGAKRRDGMRVQTSLTPARIAASAGTAMSVSVWKLRAHIAQLERAGFSSRRPLIWLQTELARPLFLAVMVLIGAAFTMRHGRSGHTGLMVLFALLSGFALYFIRNFALILGENGQLPILISVWAPPLAGLLMALGLILHLEDG
ncbi:LPS export ABC transporter permease LptG [Roseovarius sp. S4756]|uniref:LPS export ABC transporter permease LptG n=1 Tax=Roseovarius maritimus TaxID=3342637 RepID=UPI003728AAF2